MIDISGRAVRAGIRSFTAVAAVSCFAVMPQVTNNASAHTGGKAARAHDRTTPHRDHDGREGRDHGHARANLVVETKGPRGTIVPGRTYKWPFEVTNKGTVPAKDVSLTATPDRSLKVLAAPPKCRWRRTGPLVCKIGLLPGGETKRGTITATLAPRARSGKSLSNPVQVSWRGSPTPEKRLAAFSPVQVWSGTDGAVSTPQDADGRIPYPLMVTEHGPVTAESVVVRSPIGIPAPDGPCANGIQPGKIAGKSIPIKPALGACGAKQDDPAACGCSAAHDTPASDRPAAEVAPDRPASDNGSVPDKTAATPGLPAVTIDRPAASAADQPATAPCGVTAAKPAAVPDRPIVPPCAHAAVPSAADKTADKPATTPCGAAAAKPAVIPDRPIVPPCAQVRPAAGPSSAADKPAADKATDKAADKATDKATDKTADKATDKPADKAVAAPCGAAAAKPVMVPGQPVVVPNMPAIPPCAQGRPGACRCLNGQNAPVAPAAEPAAPAASAVPVAPAVPDKSAVAPCAAGQDKPMAVGKAATERPLAPSCATGQNAPAAVQGEPGAPDTATPDTATPDTIAPITPLAGLGKAAHHPLGRPHHHAPLGSGRARRDCVRQGTGFVCPLGSATHHRPQAFNLASPGHPHAFHCVGAAGAGCHTREARPVAVRSQPVHGNLPTTGGSSELLALAGLGLAGAGVVLYRLSRTRREEGGSATR
jgi:hypothetical protein